MRWTTSSESPALDRTVRRALLLGRTLGLQERPQLESEQEPDYFVFGALGILAAALAILLAVS